MEHQYKSDFSKTGYEADTFGKVRIYDFPSEMTLSISNDCMALEGVIAVAELDSERDHDQFIDTADFAKRIAKIPNHMLLTSVGEDFYNFGSARTVRNFVNNLTKVGIRIREDYLDLFDEPHEPDNLAMLIVRADTNMPALETGMLGFINMLKYDRDRSISQGKIPGYKLKFDSLMRDIQVNTGKSFSKAAELARPYFTEPKSR